MAGESFNETRGLSRIVQHLPQALHRRIDAMLKIDEGVGRPELLPQFLTPHNPPGMFDQHAKYAERLLAEPKLDTVPAHFSTRGIHLEGSKPNRIGGGQHTHLRHDQMVATLG